MSALTENAITLLESTAAVDLNGAGGTETSLYTVPTGKTCIVTHIVLRNMSADAANAVVTFGKTGGTCDDWRGDQTQHWMALPSTPFSISTRGPTTRPRQRCSLTLLTWWGLRLPRRLAEPAPARWTCLGICYDRPTRNR